MPRPEGIKQVLVLARPGIVLNPNDLIVVRHPRAHILIARLVEVPLAIPHLRLRHPRNPLERELHAPEAPGPELRELLPRRGYIVVGALRDRRRRLRRDPPAAPEP